MTVILTVAISLLTAKAPVFPEKLSEFTVNYLLAQKVYNVHQIKNL